MKNNVKYLFFSFILFVIISICIIDILFAGGKPDIDWSVESKGVYSSGISESYAYNMTGAKAAYKLDYLTIASHFYQYFNYQITDGNGEYDYRSFSEAGASLELDIQKYFNLSGEYSRSEDLKNISSSDNNLTKNAYYANLEFEIASAVLSAAYSYEKFNYAIDSNSIESKGKLFTLGADYIYNDSLGFDLTYTYSTLFFDSLGSDYSKNIFRAGCMYAPSGNLFLMSGASGGKDSEEYNIYGMDFGITFFVYSYIKLSLYYSFSYFDPTVSDSYTSTTGGGSGGGGNSSKGKKNPYLLSGKEGDTYYSHFLSLGITASF